MVFPPTCQEMDFACFSFLSHTAEIIEAPTVMVGDHKREAESIRTGGLFANYAAFCVDTVWAKRGEHLKSHTKNSYDCSRGASFSGVFTECVHLIGFSCHSITQGERKHLVERETDRNESKMFVLLWKCQQRLHVPPWFDWEDFILINQIHLCASLLVV